MITAQILAVAFGIFVGGAVLGPPIAALWQSWNAYWAGGSR